MSKRGYFFVHLIFFRGENFDCFVKVGDGTLSLSKGQHDKTRDFRFFIEFGTLTMPWEMLFFLTF